MLSTASILTEKIRHDNGNHLYIFVLYSVLYENIPPDINVISYNKGALIVVLHPVLTVEILPDITVTRYNTGTLR